MRSVDEMITIISGTLLFLAPILSGFYRQPGLLWFSLFGGAVLVLLGLLNSYKVAAVVGLIIFVAPWVFGFAGTPAATWAWIIGAVSVLHAVYKTFIADRKDQASNAQQHSG